MKLKIVLALALSMGMANVAVAGEKTYDKACAACHSTGAAGAPKVGDAAAWGPRAAMGIDALLASAIAGKGPVMQPKGGCAACSDAELKAAIEYMVNNSK